jgi:hypothetical protein
MPPLQGSKAVALSKALLLLRGRRHALLLLGRRALPVEAAGAAGWATKLHRLWGHAGLVGGWSKAKAWRRRPLLHARRGPHGTARKPGDARRRRLLVAKARLLHGRCLLEAKPWLLLHGRPLLVPKPWLLHGRGLLIAKPWLLLHGGRLLVPTAAGGLPAIRRLHARPREPSLRVPHVQAVLQHAVPSFSHHHSMRRPPAAPAEKAATASPTAPAPEPATAAATAAAACRRLVPQRLLRLDVSVSHHRLLQADTPTHTHCQ